MEDVAICIDASLTGVVTLHLVHAAWKKLERTDSIAAIIIHDSDSVTQKKFLQECVSRFVK